MEKKNCVIAEKARGHRPCMLNLFDLHRQCDIMAVVSLLFRIEAVHHVAAHFECERNYRFGHVSSMYQKQRT